MSDIEGQGPFVAHAVDLVPAPSEAGSCDASGRLICSIENHSHSTFLAVARVPRNLLVIPGKKGTPKGRGLGGDLLLASGERALAVASQVGGVALALDAKDDKAARWYERFGALPLLDDPLKLILPLSVVAEAIRTAAKRRK